MNLALSGFIIRQFYCITDCRVTEPLVCAATIFSSAARPRLSLSSPLAEMGPPGELLVLYGSVTGKAQSIAEQVLERLVARGREASLHCLGEVGKTWQLEEARTVVIVSSTTGDGEQPEVGEHVYRVHSAAVDCVHMHFECVVQCLAEPGEDRGCSTNTSVTH